MKTLILYATKHGAAQEIARRIADAVKDAVIHNINQGEIPDLADFDCVIVGSSIYVGMIRKEAKAFIACHADVLRNKTLGLFLSGMDLSKENEAFAANFPPEILKAAKAKGFLGGIFDPQKAGMMERFIMKAAAKQSGYTDAIDHNKIKEFVEELKK